MQSRLLLSALMLIISISSFAQSGVIKGNVKDGTSGESIVGANVLIAGTTQGTIADVNGDFLIPKVKAGTYNIVISFISYKTDTVGNVTVYPDQTTVVNTSLFEVSQELAEVVVTGAKVTNTDMSVITEIRKSDLVAVGISSQQISMSQDRDAAQVLKRLPGVTVTNGRFVNVRGLSERYNTVLLNGVIAPSTEVDSRAFAFDLIPSNMIDRMMVYKAGSSQYPGEFAGALINIETKSIVDDNSLAVSFTTGIRQGTTFKDFSSAPGSSTDWLGYDNGDRHLPSSFPEQNLQTFNLASDHEREKLVEASKSLPNTWNTTKSTSLPDYRMSIDFSRTANIGTVKIANLTSLSYASVRQVINQSNSYYESFDETTQRYGVRYQYQDERNTESKRVGIISNFIVELNPSHKLEFRNLFNQQGISQVTHRTGEEVKQNMDVNNFAMGYYQRQIYSGQLFGKHTLSDRFAFNWVFGYSSVNADQPDYKRIRSQRPLGSTDAYSIVLPPQSGTQDAGRFYSELKENVYTHALNVDFKLNPSASEEMQSKISAGYYVAQTKRDFNARWFAYGWSMLSNQPQEILSQYSIAEIFAPENIGFSGVSGQAPYFILKEGTNFSDRYTGENLLGAGYVSAAIQITEKLKVSPGVRIEYNRQQLGYFDDIGTAKEVDNPITSVLPFVNTSYNLTEKSLLRLTYSKTVNRPNFRELAPFNFYDFDYNANTYGNPDLVTADIHNIDLKWEQYPSPSENISFGIFYKHFKNPIEKVIQPGSNIIYSFLNADKADNYGAELEIRKSLDGLVASPFINRLSIVFNAAAIHSKIVLPDNADTEDLEKERAMQGQANYVLNTGVFYNDVETGLQMNLSHNIVGKRIYAVGDKDQNATQYELPRHQLDFTISKSFGSHWEIKGGVQDILNQKYKLTQDSDRNQSIGKIDDLIVGNRFGQYYTLGFTYRL
jgi:TonB-dependent receptor